MGLFHYNKMLNYKVVNTKSFKGENDIEFTESIILNCLGNYKEQMNHDRFNLPVDKDISFLNLLLHINLSFNIIIK